MTPAELAAFRPSADVYSTDDLERLPSSLRAEVHNGKLVIMSPARIWHQDVDARIRNLLTAAGHHAFTQLSVARSKYDTRTADVGVVRDEPTDPEQVCHDPDTVTLVVEVWSRSSDGKDRNPEWYADVGIPEYWLVEPLENDKWGALITMFELARSTSGASAYIEIRKTTLAELERSGLD